MPPPAGVPLGSAVVYEPEGKGCRRWVVLRRRAHVKPSVARKAYVDARRIRGINLDQPAFPVW